MGVTPAIEPTGFSRFAAWLDAGYGGTMQYLEDRRTAYAHPRHVLEGVRSLVVLGLGYRTVEPDRPRPASAASRAMPGTTTIMI